MFLSGACLVHAAEPSPEAVEHFERHVRPILIEACQKCHGEKKQEGDLRLDSRSAAVKGGSTGPAIVPGDVEKSLLVAAIRHEGDVKMPPKSKLTDAQIDAITVWIKSGAYWPDSSNTTRAKPDPSQHWAFQPVQDPPIPVTNPPASNPIDAFIAQKLQSAGLIPSPPADARTLIRRASYDLLGLPPTAEEVEQFVAEYKTDPKAYERLIERLLASPHYGEHWARHWLDVARYSDTKGYIYAREQRIWTHAWAYRDWVVKALNEDLPYNRFLLLQIAADQVAPDDPASQAAMGFLTLGRRFLGVTHDIIDDRIDVVTRGTMGLTVACARCHDHKYDPIPTRDYYALYGLFQSCSEQRVAAGPPTGAPDAQAAYLAELAKREKTLADALAANRNEWSKLVRRRLAEYLIAQTELSKYPEEGFDQIFTKADILPAFVRRWQNYLAEAEREDDSIFSAWRIYRALPSEEFAAQSAQATTQLAALPAEKLHPHVRKAFDQPPTSLKEVAERYAKVFGEIDRQWQASLESAKAQSQPPPTALPAAQDELLRKVLYGPASPCEAPAEPIVNIEGYFDSDSLTALWKLQNEVDNWVLNSANAPPQAVVLRDREYPTLPRVFRRGNPAQKGEFVPRQFLELLSGPNRQPFARGSGRLELAQAIVDPKNPLTARVMVNRVWLHHFGAGLVRTSSDFGVRAETPSHPELLDWLTSRFLAEGWSLKMLHRRIMLSDVYRRSSAGPTDAAQLAIARQTDPQNRLLWRMNQRRLTAEELRDSLLTAAGILDRTLGGKPADSYTGGFRRRALYGQVDRQFLPSTLRVFDFANPDLHIAQRSETTVPQQALFFLNHKLLIDNATRLSDRTAASASPEERVRQMVRLAYQREVNAEQLSAAVAFVQAAEQERSQILSPTVKDWQYGYGAVNEQTGQLEGFTKLPHYTGDAWQGGPAWPDAKLGWVQVTATGGHAGNDRAHAAVRRWTAPRDMTIQIQSTLIHDSSPGDGVRGFLLHSGSGNLGFHAVHNAKADFPVASLSVKAGETVDFCVDIGGDLNSDMFTWEVTLAEPAASGGTPATSWQSAQDFRGQGQVRLSAWALLAQVMLSANEFMFVD
jgi:hypothetical protein